MFQARLNPQHEWRQMPDDNSVGIVGGGNFQLGNFVAIRKLTEQSRKGGEVLSDSGRQHFTLLTVGDQPGLLFPESDQYTVFFSDIFDPQTRLAPIAPARTGDGFKPLFRFYSGLSTVIPEKPVACTVIAGINRYAANCSRRKRQNERTLALRVLARAR